MKVKSKNVLILGGTGFVGRHMERLTALKGHRVFSFGSELDTRDFWALSRVISDSKPDWVVSFASITTVRESFADPIATYDITFRGTLNLLMAMKDLGITSRVLSVSSSEVYGHPLAEELPLTERSPLRPMSPYAVAKLAAEYLCYQWLCNENIYIVIARPFTHIGPGQSDRFAISSFSRQIAEIMLGLKEPVIRVGDLSTTRDFTDVRDVVRGYLSLLEQGVAGQIYNVCSGAETSLGVALHELIIMSGLDIRVETDSAKLRGAEQRRIRGSYEKLRRTTGWHPLITLNQTLGDVLEFWTNELQ